MSRRDEIIDVAREILERGNADGVTMQAIADQLGIKSPSLYKHVANKQAVETALIAGGFAEQAERFVAAVDGQPDAVHAIASAYRQWARSNPNLYALMTTNPIKRDELPDGVEAAAAQPLVDAVHGDEPRARALWAFAHGMVSLELAGRFPPDADLDAAWAAGLRGLVG